MRAIDRYRGGERIEGDVKGGGWETRGIEGERERERERNIDRD